MEESSSGDVGVAFCLGKEASAMEVGTDRKDGRTVSIIPLPARERWWSLLDANVRKVDWGFVRFEVGRVWRVERDLFFYY